MKWKFHYEMYRAEMKDAMQLDPDAKNVAAEATIKKYKEVTLESRNQYFRLLSLTF